MKILNITKNNFSNNLNASKTRPSFKGQTQFVETTPIDEHDVEYLPVSKDVCYLLDRVPENPHALLDKRLIEVGQLYYDAAQQISMDKEELFKEYGLYRRDSVKWPYKKINLTAHFPTDSSFKFSNADKALDKVIMLNTDGKIVAIDEDILPHSRKIFLDKDKISCYASGKYADFSFAKKIDDIVIFDIKDDSCEPTFFAKSYTAAKNGGRNAMLVYDLRNGKFEAISKDLHEKKLQKILDEYFPSYDELMVAYD